jgi:hypothetical protein
MSLIPPLSILPTPNLTNVAANIISLLPTGQVRSIFINPGPPDAPGQQNYFGGADNTDGVEPITIQATLEEVHHQSVEVTTHPVQSSANIADHSYNQPAEIVLRCAWSNSPPSMDTPLEAQLAFMNSGTLATQDYVAGVFSQLTALKEARQPLNILTSLMLYKSMLITGIQVTRDQKTFQVLMCSITCREIILVKIGTSDVDPTAQTLPQSTAAPVAQGVQSLMFADPLPPLPGLAPSFALLEKPLFFSAGP